MKGEEAKVLTHKFPYSFAGVTPTIVPWLVLLVYICELRLDLTLSLERIRKW